jgi:membrane-bound lytic murein transglycosylase MltF
MSMTNHEGKLERLWAGLSQDQKDLVAAYLSNRDENILARLDRVAKAYVSAYLEN